jgi:predicted negative regulator of RcsB-dependent stress response
MNTKTLVLIGLVGAGAFLAYKYYKSRQLGQSNPTGVAPILRTNDSNANSRQNSIGDTITSIGATAGAVARELEKAFGGH